MTHLADHNIAGPLKSRPTARHGSAADAKRRVHCQDDRWPAVAAALAGLRTAKRCSVRIVDADCGAGTLLLCAVRHARALGFTAIEARGVDDVPKLVDKACKAAAVVHDPAIGITFETGDLVRALCEETEFPADIIVWHGCRACDAKNAGAITDMAACAGHTVISDPADADRASA